MVDNKDGNNSLECRRNYKKGDIQGSQMSESILPDDTPLEFRILLSACRLFLRTEEPSRLEAQEIRRLLLFCSRR
jgi:hypothetical protein